MVGRSSFPYRDNPPGRNRPDDLGNRRDRDDNIGNRLDRPRQDRDRDDNAGNRIDRPRERMENSGQQRRQRERGPQEEMQPGVTATPAASIDMSALTSSVEALVRLFTDNGLDELHVENGPFKLTVRCAARTTPAVVSAPPQPLALPQPAAPEVFALAAPQPAPAPAAAAAEIRATLPSAHPTPAATALAPGETLITSPMVGTFYDGPSPKDPPFVAEGDAVETGQTVGIIEAMKMMNPIEAESAGRIARILVRDGQPVEYGQPLMVLAAE